MAGVNLPSWVEELIKKGGSVEDCVKLFREINEQAREERAADRETKRLDDEMRRFEMEREVKLRELELREKELALAPFSGESGTQTNTQVKLPKFEEGQDVDVFLRSFEKIAALHKWPTAKWAIHLVPLLTGKALEAYSRLSDQDSDNYQVIKTAILKRYELTAEAYREKYREARQKPDESFKDFKVRTEGYLKHWCERENVGTDYGKLYDLVLREQLLRFCSKELQIWVHEHKPINVEQVIELVEAYQIAHKKSHIPLNQNRKYSPSMSDTNKLQNSGNRQWPSGGNKRENRTCFLCHQQGHVKADCQSLDRQTETPPQRKPGLFDKSKGKFGMCLSQPKDPIKEAEKGKGEKLYGQDIVDAATSCIKLPGVTEGQTGEMDTKIMPGLDIVRGQVSGQAVSVLRDTGSSTVFVHSRLHGHYTETGEKRNIILADGRSRQCKEVRINLQSPYVTGCILALLLDMPFADVVIGNYVQMIAPTQAAGDSQESCLVVQTRAQSKKQAEAEVRTQSVDTKDDTGEMSSTERLNETNFDTLFDRCSLSEAQSKDRTLDRVKQYAKEGQIEGARSYFAYKGDILYRIFNPKVGEPVYQIVVPQIYRKSVMSMAHDIPMAGHLGNRKTRERILHHFFWPGIFVDVANHCRSCPECQKGTPKGFVRKVPLVSVPSMEEPFQRVAIDFIGPLPLTDDKNRYILVCVDYATRYPEAFAMKSQDAETVAETLMTLFTRVGVPREIMSDQGTNFMSALMKELCRLLQVRKLSSSPYHPQANGLVEKFNSTLKKMLKTYAVTEPTRWDRHLPYVLFAYREVPNETTGFSPFELLYGRQVRGPLAILKEHWEEPEEVKGSVLSYLLETRERLKECSKLAVQNESKAKGKQKFYYDRKARKRSLEVGQKVLVLLPTHTGKMLAQWKGPYPIVEKIGDVDYKVQVSRNKQTIFHVNMLKAWFDRVEGKRTEIIACLDTIRSLNDQVTESDEREVELVGKTTPVLEGKETVNDVHICCELDAKQNVQLQNLVKEYSDVFTDIPKRTTLLKHSIKLKTEEPVFKKPYPVPYALREKVTREIDDMLNAKIIKPSTSPFASPIVLVKKKDNSIRFCCDYRALNRVTVFDPRPMPRMDDILNKVGGAQFVSKIDLTKGYWQIPLDDDACQKSAFVTEMGQFEFTVMPFGLVNAPATFVRLMKKVLSGGEDFTEAFIDDICIYSRTWEEHLEHLRFVCDRLRVSNLSARPSKCFLGYSKLEFLGHMIGKGVVSPVDDKVSSILKIPKPTTKKQVRSFLGTVGFYRKFIDNFSQKAAPLTDLTQKAKSNKIVWNQEHQHAFDCLKGALVNEPVLKSPDFTKTFILRTDACDIGVGAVLEQDFGKEGRHPILYLSKKFGGAEKNYAVVEKECFAIVWAIKALRIYLEGQHFIVETDHQPLEWLQRMKTANQRLLRWNLFLQEFRFDVRYVPGKTNVMADALSRLE